MHSQVEYVLLNGNDWREFSLGPLRQSRLRNITAAAQSMNILMGADAAIAITQQVRRACVVDMQLKPVARFRAGEYIEEGGSTGQHPLASGLAAHRGWL